MPKLKKMKSGERDRVKVLNVRNTPPAGPKLRRIAEVTGAQLSPDPPVGFADRFVTHLDLRCGGGRAQV